jgi:hypothetical protein
MKGLSAAFTCFFLIRAGVSGKLRSTDNDKQRDERTLQSFSRFRAPAFRNGAYKGTCTYEPEEFSATVAIDFQGDPEKVTDAELKALEDAFLSSYNSLASQYCDSQFKKLTNVTISSEFVDQRTRNLGETRQLQTGGGPKRFSFRVSVMGNCRYCPKNAPLFNDAARRLGEYSDVWNTRDLYLQRYDTSRYKGLIIEDRPRDLPDEFNNLLWANDCDCIKDETIPDQTVGRQEFIQQYNYEIIKLADQNVLENIDEARNIAQLVEIPCTPEDFSDFQSTVLVDLTGNPEKITQSELDLMKVLFIESYQSASADLCDPNFRIVTDTLIDVIATETTSGNSAQDAEARFVSGSFDTSQSNIMSDHSHGGRGLHLEKFRPLPQQMQDIRDIVFPDVTETLTVNQDPGFRPFTFRFRVTGRCRGCAPDDLLFNDAFRRQLGQFEEPDSMRPFGRDLGYVLGGKCYCAIDAEERPPEENEFTPVLNKNVQEDAAQNLLPNIGAITDTTQVDDTAPSASPSEKPTPFPTTSPPSVAPTLLPTTRRPTMAPTGIVPTESPAPSPQPSATPTDRSL